MKWSLISRTLLSQFVFIAPIVYFNWSSHEIIFWFFIHAVISALVIGFFIFSQRTSRVNTKSNFIGTVTIGLLLISPVVHNVLSEIIDELTILILSVIVISVTLSEVIKRADVFLTDVSKLHTIAVTGSADWIFSNLVLFIALGIDALASADGGTPLRAFDFAAILVLVKVSGEWISVYYKLKLNKLEAVRGV